jgi:hypothetical protein
MIHHLLILLQHINWTAQGRDNSRKKMRVAVPHPLMRLTARRQTANMPSMKSMNPHALLKNWWRR